MSVFINCHCCCLSSQKRFEFILIVCEIEYFMVSAFLLKNWESKLSLIPIKNIYIAESYYIFCNNKCNKSNTLMYNIGERAR